MLIEHFGRDGGSKPDYSCGRDHKCSLSTLEGVEVLNLTVAVFSQL